jgi:hypothetical protein
VRAKATKNAVVDLVPGKLAKRGCKRLGGHIDIECQLRLPSRIVCALPAIEHRPSVRLRSAVQGLMHVSTSTIDRVQKM